MIFTADLERYSRPTLPNFFGDSWDGCTCQFWENILNLGNVIFTADLERYICMYQFPLFQNYCYWSGGRRGRSGRGGGGGGRRVHPHKRAPTPRDRGHMGNHPGAIHGSWSEQGTYYILILTTILYTQTQLVHAYVEKRNNSQFTKGTFKILLLPVW